MTERGSGARANVLPGRLISDPRSLSPVRHEQLVDEEEIGKQRADVNGGIQVVDQLRTDRLLRADQLDRRQSGARIAVEDLAEGSVGLRRLETVASDNA